MTVWLGILEISTGKGIAANAGHEHPAICRRNGSYELSTYRHSPAVAAMENIRFREHEFELNPGDRLFVYTDGVTEATNQENELFGTSRMLEALNSKADANPEETIENVMNGIHGFVADAEQFDDITMLSLKYLGPQNNSRKKTVIPERTRGFAEGLVAAQLSLTGFNILEDSLTDQVARDIRAAQNEVTAPDDMFIGNMDRYIAGEHVLGMHASSLYRINALSELSRYFKVDLYTKSPLPDIMKDPANCNLLSVDNDHESQSNNRPSCEKDKIISESDTESVHRADSDMYDNSGHSLIIHNGASTLTEMPKIFNLSKINLNMTIYPIIDL